MAKTLVIYASIYCLSQCAINVCGAYMQEGLYIFLPDYK